MLIIRLMGIDYCKVAYTHCCFKRLEICQLEGFAKPQTARFLR